MARLEVTRVEKTGIGFSYTFTSKGLKAQAEFNPLAGEARVTFEEAQNMTSALLTVVTKIQADARIWETNPVLPLRIDIDAGKFADALARVAPRFGFSGPQPAGEFGTTEQFVRFRGEFSLRSNLPLAS